MCVHHKAVAYELVYGYKAEGLKRPDLSYDQSNIASVEINSCYYSLLRETLFCRVKHHIALFLCLQKLDDSVEFCRKSGIHVWSSWQQRNKCVKMFEYWSDSLCSWLRRISTLLSVLSCNTDHTILGLRILRTVYKTFIMLMFYHSSFKWAGHIMFIIIYEYIFTNYFLLKIAQ